MLHLQKLICRKLKAQNRFYRREVMPSSRKKIFLPNPDKQRLKIKDKPRHPFSEVKRGPRTNKMNIQMLSKAIYNQVFLEGYKDNTNPEILEQCSKELSKHGMKTAKSDLLEDVDFRIPPLQGKNIEEHFFNIGEKQVGPYRDLISELIKEIPQPPIMWELQEGWTRYEPGTEPQKVDFPQEEALVFDVEVCMMAGKAPTLATAVSSKAWYAWVSPALIKGAAKPISTHQYMLNSLIPIESVKREHGLKLNDYHLKPKIIIGHNVSYDRARIKEQYWLNRTGTRFVDTMSLHVCVSGVTSFQRAVLKSEKFVEEDDDWKSYSSLNNLIDVYKLYCDKDIKKDTRNLFVEGTMSDIKENFQNVMQYCSQDVFATYEILQKLFPLFLERFSHPVILAGMLELSTAYLPINENWNRYVSESENIYEDLESEGKILLSHRADQACQLLHNEKYKEDIWLWDQDWAVKNLKIKSVSAMKKLPKVADVAFESSEKKGDDDEPDPLEEKFKYLWTTKNYLMNVKPLLPGYPNWYRKLCTKPDSSLDWVPGPHLISTSMKITPKLLSLTWEGYPLHHVKDKGWGFLVPFSDDLELVRNIPLKQLLDKCPLLTMKDDKAKGDDALQNIDQTVQDYLSRKEYYSRLKKDKTGGLYKGSGIWCDEIIEDCCWFFKLPHKNGATYNVGNPLAKDFLNKFSENVLAGDTECAEQVLTIARKLSYWRNSRDRIFEQMVVWLDEKDLPKRLRDGRRLGAILPQIVVCGTLTRRAVEPTWMTASNAHKERIGSELRAMVQAPPGYNIVGADVDSQELWIASVLGDANYAKMHGATPLGWMTLSGNKANGTDMHSVTAKAVGISRDHAKVINYARIYGAGQNFAERLLRQFNPSMTESEARNKALKMFSLTKGKKIYFTRKEHLLDLPDKPYGKWEAHQLAKAFGLSLAQMFHDSKWIGGTESAMFNRLEEIASDPSPVTPFLGARLSRALEPKSMSGDKFLPTRVNWVVQSGAVDFLHLMLVCMRWIMGDKVRFCLSFHDEVRYLVPEEYKYKAALALHVTNLLTRSFCSYKLGLNDLPQSVAFFSSVEVDTVLRKEGNNDCVTPSNPHGLNKGYGIENGETLDIYEAIRKAGGQYTCWYKDLTGGSDDKSDV